MRKIITKSLGNIPAEMVFFNFDEMSDKALIDELENQCKKLIPENVNPSNSPLISDMMDSVMNYLIDFEIQNVILSFSSGYLSFYKINLGGNQ